jgi:hypothetical protein
MCLTLFAIANTNGQSAKTSSFMIMPSEEWMVQHNYATREDNQGQLVYVCDYDKAFTEDPQLSTVLKEIGSVMKGRGVQKVIDYQGLNRVNSNLNKYNALTTKATVKTSSLDKVLQSAKPDILVNVYWTVSTNGPKIAIDNFRIDAIDGFNGQLINSISGNGLPSFENRQGILLKEAVNNQIDPFLSAIESYIEDVFANGRKVVVVCDADESWTGDFDKEYNGKELKEIIEKWLQDNAVKGSAEIATNSGENQLIYDVRIPIFDENQKGLNTYYFIKPLSTMLKNAPYNLQNKTTELGLGMAKITFGAQKK